MNYTANIAISGQIDKKLSKNTKNICRYVFFAYLCNPLR
jgi:hypothetical protein